MNDNNELYDRQKPLDVEAPESVTVIGVGGVGSWVALDLALAGVEKIYLVDFDEIERHNLNRTPFKESQIGKDKIQALTELIAERRMDAEVIPLDNRIEELSGNFQEEIADSTVIDCRDHASPLPDDIDESVLMTAGYDGLEYTLHLNPDYDAIWGDENTEYETVPSFVAPPQFIASIVTVVASKPELRDGEGELYNSGNMVELIQSVMRGEATDE